ncbi:MAG: hypothetical protein AAF170_17765 [Bacteroidota bacterium]
MAKYTPFASPPAGWTESDPTTATQLDETLKEIWDRANLYSYATIRNASGVPRETARSSTTATTSGLQNIAPTSATELQLDESHVMPTGYTRSGNRIVVASAGTYRATFHITTWSTTARGNLVASLAINGTQQMGTAASFYVRDASAHNMGSGGLSTLLVLAADDEVSVYVQREGATNMYMVTQECYLTLERMA